PRLTFSDQRERQMRERCKVAAGADGASTRHVWEHAPVQTLEERLDGLDPRPGISFCQRVRAEEHCRAHDFRWIRIADAAGMAAQEPHLQLFRQLLRNGLRDEATEARVDAVRVLARSVRGALDELTRCPHLVARCVAELCARSFDGN